ncbi:hypothetical protein N7474_000481 [Penicillium riverlandense]|uniref:uncharacterized protein n=1 Tax=Penicillium riverlandense TaxID=1903569 RepID=UPI0025477E75|nr:uncharacterized protein N7474_000481 [Penicillium riverlandense]KAJ5832170.1 hypothetical protein N7474_000481 [Penicillium riverlandense]
MDEAMTDNMRSASDNAIQVAGRTYSNGTFIHVLWSRQLKATLWKSSLLPLLTGTLATKTGVGHAKGGDELVNLSKKVKVKMEDQTPPLFSEQ